MALGGLAVFGVLVTVGGCHRQDSILLVEVAGDVRLQPTQLQVSVTLGSRRQTKSFTVPAEPRAITLPTSFSIELDRSVIGPVSIVVTALDAANQIVLGFGETRQDHIQVGEDTVIAVTLVSSSGGSNLDAGGVDAEEPDAGAGDTPEDAIGSSDGADSDGVAADGSGP